MDAMNVQIRYRALRYSMVAALAALLMSRVVACESAPQETPDEPVNAQQAAPAAAEEAEEAEEADEDEQGGSCGDRGLQMTVSMVLHGESTGSEARTRLQSQCNRTDDGHILLSNCSCEGLEEFLLTSDAVEQWGNRCCSATAKCKSRGQCALARLEDKALLERLDQAMRVSLALGSPTLTCEGVVCRATEAGCRESDACAQHGQCGLDGRRCAPMIKAHCEESRGCQERGKCTLPRQGERCERGKGDCAGSEGCKKNGYCSFDENRRLCEATRPVHCEQAEACAEEGLCSLEGPEDSWSELGLPRGCYSKVAQGISEAAQTVHQALEAAMLIPLREALKAVASDDASMEARRQVRVTGYYGTEFVSAHVRTVVDPGAGGKEAVYRTRCREFIALAREVLPAAEFVQGDYRILVEPYGLRTPERSLLDDGVSVCGDHGSIHTGWVSWVGPIVTLQRSSEDSGMTTYYAERWTSLDARTGERAALDALVEEESIVGALKEDSFVKKHVERLEDKVQEKKIEEEKKAELTALLAAFHASNSLQELEGLLRQIIQAGYRGYYVSREHLFAGYGFYAYDEKKDRVAMRLALGIADSDRLQQIVTLGLWVEPRPEARQAFRRARDEGWLMSGMKHEMSGFHVPAHSSDDQKRVMP